MIRFTGELRRHCDNHFGGKCLFCLINGRKYIFDNKEEGKAFYDYWKKH